MVQQYYQKLNSTIYVILCTGATFVKKNSSLVARTFYLILQVCIYLLSVISSHIRPKISFNLYVYYLTRGLIALTRAFNLPTRTFNIATPDFSLLTRGFELVTHGFQLVTRRFELFNSWI